MDGLTTRQCRRLLGPTIVIDLIKRINLLSFLREQPVQDWEAARKFTVEGRHTWGMNGSRTGGNPGDSAGSVSFTGVMGCLPPETGAASKGWTCAGTVYLTGSGQVTNVDIRTGNPCAAPWQVARKQWDFVAYSDSEVRSRRSIPRTGTWVSATGRRT